MSQYSARGIAGWEFPPVISYGAFKAATGETIYLSKPVMLTGDRDADDGHKYLVKMYDDAASASGTIGISYQNRDPYSVSETDRDTAGRGGIRRDLAVMHEGIHDVWYTGSTVTTFGMRLAPHPDGCIEWQTGLAFLGWALEPGVTGATEDSFVRVRIQAYEPENGYFA